MGKIKNALLNLILPNKFYFATKGYCPCCTKRVNFVSRNSWLRDFFRCENCYSIPRERALMDVIEREYPNWRTLRIHESSPGNRGASIKLKRECKHYLSSQYYPLEPFGATIADDLNQDLENQTFSNETFDLVITQDVMEHIYNPGKAFSEIARTLKPGGAHIFTVPLINKHKPTEVWAILEEGKTVFLKVPEYHYNPVDPLGSPVTMHWGFDIIHFIKEKSGLDTKIEHIDDLSQGIRAEYIEVLVTKKNLVTKET